jgi:hypothetical protein
MNNEKIKDLFAIKYNLKNMELYYTRSSFAGNTLSEPRSKKDKEAGVLSKTTKTHVHNWLIENLFEKKKEISSKHIEKGNTCEDESIELYSEFLEGVVYDKNEKHFRNEFIQGTPDIVDYKNKLVIDIKTSWDMFTFPYFDTQIENKLYYWQLQCYMHLLDFKKAKLVYCLVNTPTSLINREIKYQSIIKGIDITPELSEEIKNNLTFDNLDIKDRIKEFEIEREDITLIYNRVGQIRNYIKSLGYEQEISK